MYYTYGAALIVAHLRARVQVEPALLACLEHNVHIAFLREDVSARLEFGLDALKKVGLLQQTADMPSCVEHRFKR